MENYLKEKKTDWDSYYEKPYKTAIYSRKVTEKILVRLIKRFCKDNRQLRIAELGGAGSCFFESIMMEIQPLKYTIIDNNKLGNQKFLAEFSMKYPVAIVERDILQLDHGEKFNLTLSIGLIEHFSQNMTKKAIKAHFDILEKGGISIVLFPTPTFLYRITRFMSEILGLWIFHDERPIPMKEAVWEVEKYGKILFKKINWPIFLTQGIIVAKKND